MILRELAICANELREDANFNKRMADFNWRNIEEVKDKYDDLSTITENDKRLVESYEECINKYEKAEYATRTLARLIDNIEIRLIEYIVPKP